MADDPLDANYAENMVRLRESAGLSQAELVSRLRKAGWNNVHPTTISRIEKGERPVRLSEAAKISRVLGQRLEHMLAVPRQADAQEQLHKAIERAVAAYNDLVEAAVWLTVCRRGLRRKIEEFRAISAEDDSLRLELEEAEMYLTLRIDNAIETARDAIAGDGNYVRISPGDYRPEVVWEEDVNAPDA